MSLELHVQTLNQKHADIDTVITQEEHRPHPDSIRLMQLKKEKLRLKEQLNKLATKH